MAASTNVARLWSRTQRAPLWVSISLYALAHADLDGRVDLAPSHLRYVFRTDAPTVSRAITRAVEAGWLDPTSSARCLVVAAHA
ncbi:MAG: hypothetical protein P1U38_09815 [Aeromicrobium sp.]|uniref:hypothetical protein n=1 Tax=Aeromicrobium sp. TaxID=1871063 RepID=UPI00261F5DC8|nr:hypothetical protein [Aeromicrobium sp.]MDF1705058.1 hypothetical protein [Aeromicrobium sp.]